MKNMKKLGFFAVSAALVMLVASCSLFKKSTASETADSAAEMGKTIEKYVMFRYAPHMLKKQFWMSSSDFSAASEYTP